VRLGIKPTVDFAFKKVFGTPENAPILEGLVNAILQLDSPIVELEILNPFSYQEFEEEKLIVLDIRARDVVGQWLNIEMQVSVVPGLLQRLTYYACGLYVDQLQAGQNYVHLRPAISICLLRHPLFLDTPVPHHRFRLVDPQHDREICGGIEVHTVELAKYNLDAATIAVASAIEQWAFFFLRADRYEASRLRDLLRGEEFQRAITAVETIAAKTEDRQMYDQREKALRDHQWLLEGAQELARAEGRAKGLEEGREQGREEGREQGREEGREQGREEGREEGREQGREEGLAWGALVGKIQLLQQLLSIETSDTNDLKHRSLDELTALLADLQQQLRGREKR
jgi:predicted transposase/invertase (TIGR01784 family)